MTLNLSNFARTAALLLAFAATSRSLGADGPTSKLSLTKAQAQAARLNPSLRKLDADLKAAEARTWVPLAGYLPILGISGQHLFAAQYGSMTVAFPAMGMNNLNFPGGFPQDTMNVNVHWTVFDGLRGLNQWRAADAEAEALRRELTHEGFHLRQDVAIRFYKALAALKKTEVAKQNVATLDDHLHLAKANEDTGNSTHFDVLRILAKREEAVAAALQDEDQADLARNDLAQAMGLSQDARVLEGTLSVPHSGLIPDTLAPDLDRRDDLQAQALRLEALKSRENALMSPWSPKVYLFANKQFYHYGNFDPYIMPTSAAAPNASIFGYGYGVVEMTGIGASWDIFNGGADSARLSDAKSQVKAAQEGLRTSRLQALRDFDSWKRRYRNSVRLYEARLRVLEQCKESVRLAKMGLRAGTNTNTEVLDAELDLFRARDGLVQSQSDAAEAFLTLTLLKGGSQKY